jgi:heme A synthase
MIGKIALTLLFILLIWGNLVAGLKAGLACPDWPLCYGRVLPPFRWDIYMEFMHRVIGGVTSVFIIILAYQRLRSYAAGAKAVPAVTVLLLLFQIVLGGIVVLLELPVNLTTYHFANAIVIFALTLYMVFIDGVGQKASFSLTGYKGVFFLLAILVSVQAVLGAYVRHSDAGLACPDFPTCLGYWVPPELSGIILTHFAHRALAYLITATVILLLVLSYSSKGLAKYRSEIYVILGLVVVQVLLGVLVVSSKLHFFVTALHLLVALFILTTAFYTWYRGMRESSV